MSEMTPEWPSPPATPIPAPIYTPATPEVAWDRPVPTLRTFTPTAEVEAQLDASFGANYHRCACGAMIVTSEAWCYPCSQGNRARGPIYGASLAGHTPVPGDALRAVEAVWITPATGCSECAAANERIDALLDQNDQLAAENSDLARQVVSLKGHLEEMAAAVRASKTQTPAT